MQIQFLVLYVVIKNSASSNRSIITHRETYSHRCATELAGFLFKWITSTNFASLDLKQVLCWSIDCNNYY